jgi:15-cis-phytoene desaturase
MDIIIIGAGVSGLTAAHELVKLNYRVSLIERNDDVGGIARTYQDERTKRCPIEYSWRAFGPYYQNVYNILNDIPIEKGKTAIDNLISFDDIIELSKCRKTQDPYGHQVKLELKDYVKLLPEFINFIYSSREKNIKKYSGINYRKYLEKNNYSKMGIDKLGKTIGPFWGMDYNNASLYDIFQTLEMILKNQSKKLEYNITKYPTNYAWFHPWVTHLKSQGVEILTDHEVKKFNMDNDLITSIQVLDKKRNKLVTKSAKFVVNCTGPEILEIFLKKVKDRPIVAPLYRNIKNVAKNGRQIQMSVYYYIDTKITLGSGFIYLPNSPWLLIVLPYATVWGEDYVKKYCSPKIKDVVSIGICQPYEKGKIIQKPWENCTKDEIKKECWHQLINDDQFLDTLCSKKKIEDIKIVDFKIWTTYKFKNGAQDTYEPKWANNVNTIQYRPDSETKIKNLVLGGAYTNTSTGLFSMESACESGKLAAKKVCEIDNKMEDIFLFHKERFNFTKPIILLKSMFKSKKNKNRTVKRSKKKKTSK